MWCSLLFVAAYYGLLRRLTFFGLNRAYLLGALLFAAVYPALPVPALLPAGAWPVLLSSPAGVRGLGLPGGAAPAVGFDWRLLAGGLYLLGAAGLLLRLLAQLLSLAGLHRRTRPAVALGQAVRQLPGPGGPFSFGRAIYLDASTLTNSSRLLAALRHEQAHVRQGHTLDALLAHLAAALAWPNPAAWLLRRAVLTNLEFLADRAAMATPGEAAGLDRRAYQFQLLARQGAAAPAGPALAFHFTSSTLKNRIAMLNQPVSSPRQRGRYLLAAPLVVALALGYSAAQAQTAAPRIVLDAPAPTGPKPIVYVNGQRLDFGDLSKLNPDDIANVSVVKEAAALSLTPDAVGGAILVTTKGHEQDPAVRTFNARVDRLLPAQAERPLQVNALVPKALATITARYPDARLSGEVVEITDRPTGKVKYRVQLITGRRPFYIYLTPAGDFLAE